MEKRILELHSMGLTNRAIGLKLGIHHKKVATFLIKLGLKTNGNGPKKLNIVSEGIAKCSKCLHELEIEQFQFVRKNSGRISYCNMCRKIQSYERLNNSKNTFLKDSYNRLKARSKKFGIYFTVSFNEYIEQFNNQNGKCFYSDIKMILIAGCGKNENSLSTDKIIPELGYIKGNIVFCINKINTCKNNLSLNQIKEWMPGWYKRILKFRSE